MKKVLITGSSGFVGFNLTRFFANRYLVVATYFSSSLSDNLKKNVIPVQLDVTDNKEVLSIFQKNLPDVVIHVAGNKDVKYCESNEQEAYQINAQGTQNVARACQFIGAKMIYLSTDLIFSCTEGNYKETDTPQPSLIYGKTKLKGEELAQKELQNIAICRSGGIYGENSPLLHWLSSQLKLGHKVEGFTDVFNTPTYAINLAEMIESIIQKGLNGIFHTVGSEKVSRFQLFQYYAKIFGWPVDLIIPAEFGNHNFQALLQADSSLSSICTSNLIERPCNTVGEGLERLKLSGGLK